MTLRRQVSSALATLQRVTSLVLIPFYQPPFWLHYGFFCVCLVTPGLLYCRQILYHLSHQGSPLLLFYHSKRKFENFPGGAVDRKSACQCRGNGFDPWSGKIPRAAEPLSPWTTATKPELPKFTHLEPVLCNRRSPHTATKTSPPSLQLEKALTKQQRSSAAKMK